MYTNEELKELKKQQLYLENMLNKENDNKDLKKGIVRELAATERMIKDDSKSKIVPI